MSFSDFLQQKLAERRRHGSPVQATTDALRQQAFQRIRPVHDATAEMIARLTEDRVFSAALGREPKLAFKWSPDPLETSQLCLDAPIGTVFVWVIERNRLDGRSVRTLALRIMPDWPLANALGCGTFYAEATPVEGDIADLPGFLVAVEDMPAEFLADVLISPLADRYLPGAA